MNKNKPYIYAEAPKIPLGTEISVDFEFVAICPIPEPPKPYGGVINISYTPKVEDGKLKLLEWDFFNVWIKSLRSELMSAEEMAHTVMCAFLEAIDPEDAALHMKISTPLHLPVDITLKYQAKR